MLPCSKEQGALGRAPSRPLERLQVRRARGGVDRDRGRMRSARTVRVRYARRIHPWRHVRAAENGRLRLMSIQAHAPLAEVWESIDVTDALPPLFIHSYFFSARISREGGSSDQPSDGRGGTTFVPEVMEEARFFRRSMRKGGPSTGRRRSAMMAAWMASLAALVQKQPREGKCAQVLPVQSRNPTCAYPATAAATGGGGRCAATNSIAQPAC